VKLDGARVRAARGRSSQWQVAAHMRRLDVAPTTQRGWVSMVERDLISPPEPLATALAAALGVGLSQLLPADAPMELRLAAVQDDLHTMARQLQAIAAAIGREADFSSQPATGVDWASEATVLARKLGAGHG
jgi:transcriptional regulator with XRE-family HTH domain